MSYECPRSITHVNYHLPITHNPSSPMKRNLGNLLLAIYLILVGVTALFSIRLGEAAIVMPILALAAGILLLLGK